MKFVKQLSVYTLVGFLNAGIGFLILPILTHYLTPTDYGIISLMNVYVQILMPIVGLSTAAYISVEHFNKNLNSQQFREVFTSVRVIPLLMVLPFAIIFLIGMNWLPQLMELPMEAYLILLPLTLFVLYADNFKSFLVITKRLGLFSITTLGKVIIEIPLTLGLIVYAHRQWDGRIYAWLFTVLLFTLISLAYYKRWKLLSFKINKGYVRQAIIFGAPLIMHQVGKFVINQSDRLFLTKMISIEEMGVYSVGYQIGTVILIVVSAFSNFFSPFLLERLNKNSIYAKMQIVRASYIFIIGLVFILVFLTLLTPAFFEFFISEKFSGGAKYVFWIGLSYVFWGIYIVFTGYIFYLRKNKILAYLSIINVVINLSCNYIFIKNYGAIGAAYATCLSFLIVGVLIAIISNRLFPMPWFAFRALFKLNKPR